MALFNIRVYGLLINNQNQILVSDENIKGHFITKFPGGGLEFGEGTMDCIKREFIEETNTKIEVLSHFYTTDLFFISAFNHTDQIISIYYLVKNIGPIQKKIATIPFDFSSNSVPTAEAIRWVNIAQLTDADVTLPIDKIVVNMLLQQKKI